MATPFELKGGENRREFFIKEFSGSGTADSVVTLDLPPGFYYLGVSAQCTSIAGGTGTIAVRLYANSDQTATTPADSPVIAIGSGKLATLVTTGNTTYVAIVIDENFGATAEYGRIIPIPFGVKVTIDHGTITSGTYTGSVFAQRIG